MDNINITIIGAGVVGLAIAAELANTIDNIVVLEKNNSFGQETSSRNSEVIHSGIYYPHGSLKARLCIEGAEQLYDLCEKHSIPYKKTGKLIVASEQSELKMLDELFERGKDNGVKGLMLLDKKEINQIETVTNAIRAIYSPNTGIVDSHSLMKHYYNQANNDGVLFSFNSEVNRLNQEKDAYVIGVQQENFKFKSKVVINCAGLLSDHIASLVGIDIQHEKYKLRFCKGSYFSYAKSLPIHTLIYPVAPTTLMGLGVHATFDLGGRLRFGPDAEYIEQIDFKVDVNKKDAFYQEASKMISGLEKDSFMPDMAGIRPKLYSQNGNVRDFVVTDEDERGLPGFINLIGIESPGLTASPAIAKKISAILSKYFN